MPTYEYECTSCGGQFDIFHSIKDAPKEICETCGGKLTKLMSAGAGLIFKGSGFYITDYKKGDSASGSEGSKSSGGDNKDSKGESGSTNKADSPPSTPTTEKKSESSPSTEKKSSDTSQSTS